MLRPGLRPAATLTDLDRIRLAQAGVNVLHAQRAGGRALRRPAHAAAGGRRQDRLALSGGAPFCAVLMASIERGTRWVRFEHGGPPLWAQVCSQVTAFFESLEHDGAFVGRRGRPRITSSSATSGSMTPPPVAGGQFQLLFGFATVAARRVPDLSGDAPAGQQQRRAVSVNRYALPT